METPSSTADPLTRLRAEYPAWEISVYGTDSPPRYCAAATSTSISLHTVITGDLDEMERLLAAAAAPGLTGGS